MKARPYPLRPSFLLLLIPVFCLGALSFLLLYVVVDLVHQWPESDRGIGVGAETIGLIFLVLSCGGWLIRIVYIDASVRFSEDGIRKSRSPFEACELRWSEITRVSSGTLLLLYSGQQKISINPLYYSDPGSLYAEMERRLPWLPKGKLQKGGQWRSTERQ
jgi:hypothetical protein